MARHIVCVGAVYIDTILSVPTFPAEDEKLRATGYSRRRGGNCANSLEVLSQLVSQDLSAPSKNSESPESGPHIHLISVLPKKDSLDVQFIRNSIPHVGIDDSCIFRDEFSDAASSYIIQAAKNNSRTIVSYNPIPEMTTQEFIDRAAQVKERCGASEGWYHFEGRIQVVTGDSVKHIRSAAEHSGFKISVECEKPEREYMMLAARDADAVFFSKIWAQANNCNDSRTFLESQLPTMRPGAILVSTWGSKGATCVRKTISDSQEDEWATVKAWQPPDGPSEVIDTIGAGDTFNAGFLYTLTYHEDWSLEKKLGFANELAGRKVLQHGFEGLGKQIRS